MLRALGFSKHARRRSELQDGLKAVWEAVRGNSSSAAAVNAAAAAAASPAPMAAAAAVDAVAEQQSSTPERVAKVIAHSFHK